MHLRFVSLGRGVGEVTVTQGQARFASPRYCTSQPRSVEHPTAGMRSLFALAAAAAVATAANPSDLHPDLAHIDFGEGAAQFQLVMLPNSPNDFGAMCLDGSPVGFYWSPGTGAGANNWMFYFRESREKCGNAESATQRDDSFATSSPALSSRCFPQRRGRRLVLLRGRLRWVSKRLVLLRGRRACARRLR